MAGGSRSIFKRLDDPQAAVERAAALIGDEARKRLMTSTNVVGVEDLHGRLIARTLKAPRSLPWYPRSLVDGCAVNSIDVAGAFEDRPAVLKYLGRVKIGSKPRVRVDRGGCVEVDTGSWIPLGSDAVVPIEYVEVEGGEARVFRAVRPGQGLAPPASDVAEGDIIVKAGTPWTPYVTPALASLGVRRVEASRRPLAAVFSVGDELVEPGVDPGEAGIFDSNRYFIISSLRAMGWEILDLGVAGDRIDDVEDRVSKAVESGADLILSSGGTSAGLDDVVYRAASKLGSLIAHGLRIKPGKPTVVAVVESIPFIGLPGNPRSAANVFERVVVGLLDALRLPTWPFTRRAKITATLTTMLHGERGRDTIVPVALVGGEKLAALPVARDSYMIASYAWSDGEVVVPAGLHAPYEPGELVQVDTYWAPRRRLLVLADEVDVEGLVEKYGLDGAVYAPSSKPAEILKLLPSGSIALVSTISLSEIPEGWKVEEDLGSREITLTGSNPERCARLATPAVYSNLKPAEYVPYPVPRIRSARILLDQKYVDCAILPGGNGPILGREKLLVLRRV